MGLFSFLAKDMYFETKRGLRGLGGTKRRRPARKPMTPRQLAERQIAVQDEKRAILAERAERARLAEERRIPQALELSDAHAREIRIALDDEDYRGANLLLREARIFGKNPSDILDQVKANEDERARMAQG